MTRAALLSGLLILAGCSRGEGPVVAPEYDATSGRLTRLEYDSNRDGRPDIAASMDGRTVKVIEIDADHDGLADRWEYYEAAVGSARDAGGDGQRLMRVEQVSRRGAIVVRREGYEAGELAWVREDRDADGRIDRWETYARGALRTVDIDSAGTGRPDRRLRYDGDQVLVEVLN
jgi:hypothetical protein